MKNINKKLIFVGLIVMTLSMVFAPSANAAMAAMPPTVTASAATSITTTSAVLNGTINPNGSATSAWFDFNSTNVGTQNGLNGNSAIPMSSTVSNLTPNTTYSFRVGAVNVAGFVNSNVISFTTASNPSTPVPTISGVSASSITSNSATLNGSVNPNGSPTSAWFDFNSNNYGTQNNLTGNVAIPLTYALTGLTPNTSYSYRIEAINGNGAAIGLVVNFTTLNVSPNAPIVTTISPATNITQTTATISGIVDPNGGGSTTVDFMLNGSPVAICNQTILVPSTLNCNLTGLTLSTTYSYFVTATNANGTTNGTTFQFTTLNAQGQGGGGGGGGSAPETPIVTTNAATSISATSVNLNAFVDANGYSTTHWFQWGTSQNDMSRTTSLIDQKLSSGVFTAKLTDLTPKTTYYFRGAASSSQGTIYGGTLAFVTGTSSGPNVSGLNAATTVASGVGKTSAKLNGLVLNANNSAESWFEYGASVALGKSTSVKAVTDASSAPVAETVTDLAPDTIYFFQLKARNQAGLVYGEIRVFRTASNVSNVNTGNAGNGNTGGEVTALDLVSLKIEADKQTASPEDNINFTVSYKNIGTKNLKDVLVRVDLPKDIEFANSNAGTFSDAEGVLSANIGDLNAGQEGTLTLSGKVAKGAVDKDTLVTTASLVYTDSSGNQADALDYALVNVDAPNLLPAASIFGSGFLPSTLLGWLTLILVALGLVLLGRKFYGEVNWANALASVKGAFRKDEPPTNLPQ